MFIFADSNTSKKDLSPNKLPPRLDTKNTIQKSKEAKQNRSDTQPKPPTPSMATEIVKNTCSGGICSFNPRSVSEVVDKNEPITKDNKILTFSPEDWVFSQATFLASCNTF